MGGQNDSTGKERSINHDVPLRRGRWQAGPCKPSRYTAVSSQAGVHELPWHLLVFVAPLPELTNNSFVKPGTHTNKIIFSA